MAAVNRYPDGLLQLLGTKSLGRTQTQISDTVVGTVAMDRFYLNNVGLEIETDTQTTATGVTGSRATIVIPDGELWEIVAIEAAVSYTSASAVVRFGPCLNLPDAGVGVTSIRFGQTQETILSLASGDTRNQTVVFPQPILVRGLGGATSVGTNYLYNAAGANTTARTTVIYYNLA